MASKPTTRWQRWRRRLLIALMIPVLLVGLLLAVLHSGPGQRYVRDKVQVALAKRVNGTLQIDALEFSLFGDLALRGVTITDTSGREAVHLGSLLVTPRWSTLLSDDIHIEQVQLKGIRLSVVQNADGSSSLSTLIKPKPPEPEPKEPPKKKAPKRIRVHALELSAIDVTLDKPDGTHLEVQQLAIDGRIDTTPANKALHVTLDRIATAVKLDKREQGLALSLSDIRTGIELKLKDGAGSVKIAETKARASILRGSDPLRSLDLDLAGVELAIEPGQLKGTIDKLLAGVLMLESLEVRGGSSAVGLVGQQQFQVVGLKLDHEKLNKLLQRQLLVSDIALETQLHGPADKVVVKTTVSSDGGNLSLDGLVNAANVTNPSLALTLRGNDLDTTKLLRSDKIPPIRIGSLLLDAKASGSSRDKAEADVDLNVTGVQIRDYLIDEVLLKGRYERGLIRVAQLQLDAYGYRAMGNGTVDLGSHDVDMHLTMEGDVGDTLARLRAAGVSVKTKLPSGAAKLRAGVFNLHIKGKYDDLLDVRLRIDRLPLAGGEIVADIRAKLRRNPPPATADAPKKAIALEHIEGTAELRALSLDELKALATYVKTGRGKIRGNTTAIKGLSGRLYGTLKIDGTPEEPHLGYRLVVKTQPNDAPHLLASASTLTTTLHGKLDKRWARLNLGVQGSRGEALKELLLDGEVRLPLFISDDHRGIDPFRQLRVKLDMPPRKLGDLLHYLPPQLLLDKASGEKRKIPKDALVEAHIDVQGTSASPHGPVKVDVHIPALGTATQRLKLDGLLRSETPSLSFTTNVAAWLDASKPRALHGTATVAVSRSPLLGPLGALSWSTDLHLAPLALGELPLAALKKASVRGSVDGRVQLSGGGGSFKADVDLNGKQVYARGIGPLNATVGVDLGDDGSKLDLTLKLADQPLLIANGGVELAGWEVLETARAKSLGPLQLLRLGTTKLNLDITIPKQRLAGLAALKPVLAELPGFVGGGFKLEGTLGSPQFGGSARYDGFTSLAGTPGLVAVALRADGERASLTANLGSASAAEAVSIRASVDPGELLPYLGAKRCYAAGTATDCASDAQLTVKPSIRAADVDIRRLIPVFALKGRSVDAEGLLDWTLDGDLILDPKPRYSEDAGGRVLLPPIAPNSSLSGGLTLHHARFGIPGSARQYNNIDINIRHDPNGLTIDKLSARESDREKKNRSIDVRGALVLKNWRPDSVNLSLKADDWLVFGSDMVGPADAPRGSLDIDAQVNGSLAGARKNIDVEIRALELLIPNRFRRAHQPEKVSLGDVVVLPTAAEKADAIAKGKDPADFPAIGKLPTSAKKKPAPSAPDPPAPKSAEPAAGGLHVAVRIPKPIHVLQHPMNLYARGTIAIDIANGERVLDGKLEMTGGDLALGGKKHQLQVGSILFNREHAGGYMDLLFGRREHNAALRDTSQASGGELVKIHLQGPLNARRTTLSGAGSPGTLFDLLSMHNAGRPRYYSQPDMPASATVEFPQHMNLLLLSYLSVNVPHLLFLDRAAAWADAYDERGSHGYGQIQRYEAERYSDAGDLRLRAVMRPRTPGRSTGEAQLDYLFENTPQTAAGVGVSVGTRGGGGPGVFWEWSSKD